MSGGGQGWKAIAAGVALGLAMIAVVQLRPHREPARNLILISLDTLRADHLGAYGYERPTSPAFDALAQRGALFRRAVAHAPSTAPSHGALLTSLYPSAFLRDGDQTGGPPITADTLAEMLERYGFSTWGFTDGGYMRGSFGFSQGFDHYDDRKRGIAPILATAKKWLSTHKAERFFLMLHCYDIHTPYGLVPPEYLAMFGDASYPDPTGRAGPFHPSARYLSAAERGRARLNERDLREVIARYDSGIRWVDDQIGAFVLWLEQTGLLASTVLVITADHGEEFFEHASTQHKQLYLAPNLHVPLLIIAPGVKPRIVESTVELIDVVPTILDLLGIPPKPGLMGTSLIPLIDGKERDSHDPAFAAYAEPAGILPNLRTLVTQRFQLVHDLEIGTSRLFDLDADPWAKTDVAAQNPEVVRSLEAELKKRMAAAREKRVPMAPAPPKIDPATRRQLEALGYLEPSGEADAKAQPARPHPPAASSPPAQAPPPKTAP